LDQLPKQNRISIITSSNKHFLGHKKRLDFIDLLMKSELGKYVDLYGGGHNPIPDKMDGIYPYKYHIVLENSSIPDYWTEKLADAFLGMAFPFYYGCPNVHSYFPGNALQQIDIDNPMAAIAIIDELFSEQVYEERLSSVLHARHMVLNRYNMFNIFTDVCSSKSRAQKEITLRPPGYFSSKRSFAGRFMHLYKKNWI
jgi:hypothetical protein